MDQKAAHKAMTPMMKQYMEIKEQYQDCILFYRLGDFYEMFYDDAINASKELELTLTGKSCGQEERAPMCGVPYHSCEAYIARLVEKGYKVAVCEQTEDPKQAKGIVKRDVVRMITPGTVIESSMLDESKNNYICSVYADESGQYAGLCFADISTGEVYASAVGGVDDTAGRVIAEIGRYMPAEAVINRAAHRIGPANDFFAKTGCSCVELDSGCFDAQAAEREMKDRFGKDISELKASDAEYILRAIGGLMHYLYDTQKNDLSHLNTLNIYKSAQYMQIGFSTKKNLEICETMRGASKKGSLLWAIDRTKTSMGGRLLRGFLERPLLDVALITKRQDACAELMGDMVSRSELGLAFKGVLDLERLIGRVVYGTANCRDLRSICETAKRVPEIQRAIAGFNSAMMRELKAELDPLDDLSELIDRAVEIEPPFSVREGGFIKSGYSTEVDKLRELINGGKDIIGKIEAEERQKTGIKNLKVGYTKVFGYYIEVTKSYYSLVPENYIRKQTLANCERYITSELKDIESQVLTANERITEIEYELFCEIVKKVSQNARRVQKTARAIATLDVLYSLAETGVQNGYSMPCVNNSDKIIIKDGRHPVVEQINMQEMFVPNDTELDCDANRMLIITGPNMAGKSTYMRQIALIVILAQIGAPIPAKSAEIGICDKVFTRIGASDDLAAGQSTFMVEMSEVAEILECADSKSLIILDEIGRGTSTFDGMAIARAVLEYAVEKSRIGARTMFATHYHELTRLEGMLDGVKNYNIAVKKRGDDITFLRKIVRGGADQSYGIEVAKLSGIPDCVIQRAKEILTDLESGRHLDIPAGVGYAVEFAEEAAPCEPQPAQLTQAQTQVIEQINNTDMNVLTPIEAMNVLFNLKKRLEKENDGAVC